MPAISCVSVSIPNKTSAIYSLYFSKSLTSKEFNQILDSAVDKDGKLCDTAMSLAVTLSRFPILKEHIGKIILSAKLSSLLTIQKFIIAGIRIIPNSKKEGKHCRSRKR